MTTLSISSPPVHAGTADTYSINPFRLHYECSSHRRYAVWLLSHPQEETQHHRVFGTVERDGRREGRQALLIDLRQQRFFYRAPTENNDSAAAPSESILQSTFGHDTLCVQLTHYLLTEIHHHLATNDAFITSLAGNLTACLIREINASPDEHVGITPYQLKQVEQYTQDHMDRRVTLDELAAVVELSSFHFARQFKQAVGESPYQYVVRLKMQYAKERLLTTQASVIDIGMQVGYDNSSHFSRAFRRNMGVSPTQLRKTLRREAVKLSA